jgi:hypothetical protein
MPGPSFRRSVAARSGERDEIGQRPRLSLLLQPRTAHRGDVDLG